MYSGSLSLMKLRKSLIEGITWPLGDELNWFERILQIFQRVFGSALRGVSPDRELPGLGIDLGNHRDVIAHEEGIVGRERVVEILQRRLVGPPQERRGAGGLRRSRVPDREEQAARLGVHQERRRGHLQDLRPHPVSN